MDAGSLTIDSAKKCKAVWNKLPPQHPTCLQTFIAAIVRNISITRVRERCAKKHGGGEYALALDELSDCLSSEGSVEHEFELKEIVRSIDQFLYTLSADDRLIFICRYWLFTPVAEIAARKDYSQSKVLTSLFRTRQKLQLYLTKEGLV